MTSLPLAQEGANARDEQQGGAAPSHAEIAARVLSTMVGRTLGPYLVERRLGGGAMASVYAARDLRTQQPAALKVLLPDADETVRARFRLEALTVSQLDHPHIVHTFEVADWPGAGREPVPSAAHHSAEPAWIAMEMVEGENLGDLLDRVRTLHAVDVAALLAPVARALAYAHSRNVVHRDVKPSNILLRSGATAGPHAVRLTAFDAPVTPLLSDFGIARALDAPDLTSAGRTIGTPAYMAPEQCAGSREIDGRADIYSLGAVLYRALVGRAPYSGSTTQILYAHVYEPLTIPEDVLMTLPPLLVEVLKRALAKEPADRYPDVQQMADDLTLCAGRATTTSPAVVVAPPHERTATMATLEPAIGGAGSAAQSPAASAVILVPSPLNRGTAAPATLPAQRRVPASARPGAPAPTQMPLPVAPLAPAWQPPEIQTQGHRRRWRGSLVALALALPMLLGIGLAVSALLKIGPFFAETSVAAATPEPTRPAATPADTRLPVAQSTPVDAGSLTATPRPHATTALSSTATFGATPLPVAAVEPVPTPPAGSPTPTFEALPTPAGDIVSFWEEAQLFHEERDWGATLNWLTLIQRIDPQFEQVQVQRLLADVLIAFATSANSRSDWDLAILYYRRALDLQPQNAVALGLLAATEEYARAEAAGGPEVANAQRLLQIAHQNVAERLLRENRICDAADQFAAAVAILPESRLEAAAVDSARRCSVQQMARADQRMLQSLSGHLVYSTQLPDGRYAIYAVAALPGSTATLLLADARQPALSGDGRRLAYYSTVPGEEGLWTRDLTAGTEPGRVSAGALDAADSPPAWNFAGTQLVYSGMDADDGRARIYRADLPERNVTALALGQSPGWNWSSNRIAFNGLNETGGAPGLHLMRPDGGREGPLTDNGNDLRPSFSPDGATLAFMSSGRSVSWDVFLLSANAAEPAALTSDQAQDGLPAFSPDGRYVAWMSDRGGRWNIWVQAIDPAVAELLPRPAGMAPAEPRELLLAPVQGTLTQWLEHNLVWIP